MKICKINSESIAYGDGNVVISKDESSVDAGEFVVFCGHFSSLGLKRIYFVVLVVDIIRVVRP